MDKIQEIENDIILPNHIDEQGNKFYIDKISTDYAKSKRLSDVYGLFIKKPNGYISRCIVDYNEIVFESTSLEEIGTYIDMIALSKKFE